MDHLISARRPDLMFINKKKRICHLVDFADLVDHREKIEENEKIENTGIYQESEKKLWIMKVAVIPIVDSVLGTFHKDLERRLKLTGN